MYICLDRVFTAGTNTDKQMMHTGELVRESKVAHLSVHSMFRP
jgi:hypothetical protein